MPSTRSRARIASLSIVLAAFVGLALGAEPARAGTGSVSLLLKLNEDPTEDVLASIRSQTIQISHIWPQIRALAVVASPRAISDLRANPYVALVEEDLEASVTGDPHGRQDDDDPLMLVVVPYGTSSAPIQTWNLDMANTSGPSETGAGVTVAVLDSGLPQNWEEFLPPGSVDLEHAAGIGAQGWGDFHSELHAIRGVGGHIGLFPHGLAVASVIAGFPSDFGPIGGAAPGAKILPIRVLNQFNVGWFSWFTAGILHVANLKASGAVPGPLVVNFSIQATGSSQVMTDAIDYALSQGVLFVTIAGNFHPFANVSYPGRLPQSITSGAAGWRSEGLPPHPWFFGDVPEADASQVYISGFSCREAAAVPPASQIDVVAPGSFVFGEWLYGSGFSEGRQVAFLAVDNFLFGTSFAAPHVAGIVARMLEKNPGLSQSGAEAALRGTALPIPASGPISTPFSFVPAWDGRATGTGLVQGAEAVAATPPPLVSVVATARGRLDGAWEGNRPALRVLSRVGSVPVEMALRGFGEGARRLRVWDVNGRLVRSWTSVAPDGATWDGARADGAPASSGIYFVQAEGDGVRSSAKVVIAR